MSQVNNDLRVGEETRLPGRFMGKPLYARLIDFGNLPGAGVEKSVPHGIAGLDQYGIDNGRSYVAQGHARHALFYPNAVPNGFWRAKLDADSVSIQVGEDRSTFTALVCVWYTKLCDAAGIDAADSVATGRRSWESGWFDIAASKSYAFRHDLHLAQPWHCRPVLVARVKQPMEGWTTDEVIFYDGANYVGATASSEIGWAITMTGDTALVSFGNDTGFLYHRKAGGMNNVVRKPHVECKLLIDY